MYLPSSSKLPPYIQDMDGEFQNRLQVYQKAPLSIAPLCEVVEQIMQIKEILEDSGDKELYKWFNKSIIKVSLQALNKQDEKTKEIYDQIQGLKFRFPKKDHSFSQQNENINLALSSQINQLFYNHFNEGDLIASAELNSLLFDPDSVPFTSLQSQSDLPPARSLSIAEPVLLPDLLLLPPSFLSSSSPFADQESSSLAEKITGFSDCLLEKGPANWDSWFQESIENTMGYLLRIFQNPQTKYPLNQKDKEKVQNLIKQINLIEEGHHFYLCKDLLIDRFHSLSEAQSFAEVDNLISALLHQNPLRSLIIEELKLAMNPIMRHLADQEVFNSNQIIQQMREIQNVLRRWRLIEQDDRFGSQADSMECLQAIFSFLQETKDEHFYADEIELTWQAETDLNESHWLYQDIDLDNETEETKQLLIKLGKKSLNKEKKETVSVNESVLIDLGRNYLIKLVEAGSLKDENGQELDELPLLETAVKPHLEKAKLPLIMHIPIQEGVLVRNHCLDDNLHHFFKEVESFTGYRIKNSTLQKITLPVQKTTIQLNGHPPETLFLEPQAIYNSDHSASLPTIDIPEEITFGGQHYLLSKSAVKSGSQLSGHYTFWTRSSKGSQYADSLTDEDFIQVETPLNQSISGQKNVALLEYKRKDINPTQYEIKHKLYQGFDNLCYLIQTLYFIYGNSCFSPLNTTNATTLHISSPLPDETIKNFSPFSEPQSPIMNEDTQIALAMENLYSDTTHIDQIWETLLPRKQSSEQRFPSEFDNELKRKKFMDDSSTD